MLPEGDAVRSLRGRLDQVSAAPRPLSGHERKVALAARSCFSRADGALVLEHLESLTLRTVHPPGTPNEVLQYREGMRQMVWLIRALMTEGEKTDADPGPTAASA